MGHFAKVIDGVVEAVIVAEQEYIDTLLDKELYIQTSYNTRDGVHLLGGTPLRHNYAGIGYSYNSESDVFMPPGQNIPIYTDGLPEDTGNIA